MIIHIKIITFYLLWEYEKLAIFIVRKNELGLNSLEN